MSGKHHLSVLHLGQLCPAPGHTVSPTIMRALSRPDLTSFTCCFSTSLLNRPGSLCLWALRGQPHRSLASMTCRLSRDNTSPQGGRRNHSVLNILLVPTNPSCPRTVILSTLSTSMKCKSGGAGCASADTVPVAGRYNTDYFIRGSSSNRYLYVRALIIQEICVLSSLFATSSYILMARSSYSEHRKNSWRQTFTQSFAQDSRSPTNTSKVSSIKRSADS